jgi:hypothetical protein
MAVPSPSLVTVGPNVAAAHSCTTAEGGEENRNGLGLQGETAGGSF